MAASSTAVYGQQQQQPDKPPDSTGTSNVTSTAAEEQEEDEVFEIREWIDDAGQEVSSEVFSVHKAAQAVKNLDLVGTLERAVQEAKKKDHPGANSTSNSSSSTSSSSSRRQQQAEGREKEAEDKNNNKISRLLDDHDWAAIQEKATEIEKLQTKAQLGDREVEADKRKGRHKLEGNGWAKGFLNNKSSSNGSSASRKSEDLKEKNNETIKAFVPHPKAKITSRPTHQHQEKQEDQPEYSSPASSPNKPRKHVTFNLSPEQQKKEALDFGHTSHLFFQHQHQIRQQLDTEEEEVKAEEKRTMVSSSPSKQKRHVAFSGAIAEMASPSSSSSAAVADKDEIRTFSSSFPSSLSPSSVGGGGGMVLPHPQQTGTLGGGAAGATSTTPMIPPGMSKFKARALGLLPPESN